MHRSNRGFTLLEILIAMSLFTLIGFAVVLLMRVGVDMWVAGTRGGQVEDRREQSLPRLEEDLRHVLPSLQRPRRPFDPKNPDPEKEPEPLPPDNRFISGYQVYKIKDRDVPCRYLCFVRDLTGLAEIEIYAARAGQNARATSRIDGKNDEDEFARNDHMPTGGMVEVLWIWLPDDTRPGVGTVYRAFRTPIGGPETLLDPKNFDDLDELKTQIKPQPMVQAVALFDCHFWTQWTTTWDWTEGEPVVTGPPKSANEIRQGRPACGPSRTWDSTRAVLDRTGSLGFKLGLGSDSLRYLDDDIWPKAVRVEFAIVEERTVLTRGLGTADQSFTVAAPDFATGRGDLAGQHMKVGPEWIQVRGRDGDRRDTFQVWKRGERGTTSLVHGEETPVYYGRIFDFTIPIPAYRDDNN